MLQQFLPTLFDHNYLRAPIPLKKRLRLRAPGLAHDRGYLVHLPCDKVQELGASQHCSELKSGAFWFFFNLLVQCLAVHGGEAQSRTSYEDRGINESAEHHSITLNRALLKAP